MLGRRDHSPGGGLFAKVEGAVQAPHTRRNLFIAYLALSVVFSLLVGRLWYMQVLKGDNYRKLSENNRVRLVDMPPSRGLIFDSKGRLLADNRPAFTLAVVPEDVSDWKTLTRRLTSLIDLDPAEIERAKKAARGQAPFKPIKLRSHLDRHQLSLLETFRYELPGVRVLVEYRRAYLAARETAHVIGYLGEINKKELRKAPRSLYRLGDYVGRYGLESSRERVLHGRRGVRQVEVDAVGRELTLLKEAEAVPGQNLILSIDLDLQKAAADAFRGQVGAVAAINPKTGEVYCLYSSPSFDQNSFIWGMTGSQWKELSKDPLHPLEDRAISGVYPPGSTYKIITAAAALAEGVVTPSTSFYCAGQMPFGRRVYKCWAIKKGGHGNTDLHKALRESCDVYFYKVGQRLGVDRLAKYAKAFGLGRKSGVSLPHENPGLVPTSKWKKRRFGEPWQEGETLSVSIGQSFNLVTPLQLARMVSVIANRGRLVTPTLVKAVVSPDGTQTVPEPLGVISRVPVKPEFLDLIHKGLVGVVNEQGGTARKTAIPGVTVAAKTGTAQVVALKFEKSFGKEENVPWKYRSHALFVCYAPAEDPTIAMGIVVEHGMHGGSACVPVAKRILRTFLGMKEAEADKKPAPGQVVMN